MNGYCLSILYGVVIIVSKFPVFPNMLGSVERRDLEKDPCPVIVLFLYPRRLSII